MPHDQDYSTGTLSLARLPSHRNADLGTRTSNMALGVVFGAPCGHIGDVRMGQAGQAQPEGGSVRHATKHRDPTSALSDSVQVGSWGFRFRVWVCSWHRDWQLQFAHLTSES